MALPSAIKEAGARADDLQKKFKSGTLTVEDIGKPINAPTNPTPTPEAPAPAPAAAAPTPPAPAPAPAAPPPPPPGAENVDWQHKFNVLQGKYNAEVPRLHEQNRTLAGQVQSIQQQLASTQSLLATLGQQQVQPAPQNASGKLVKDEEIKEFGPDLYDFIRRTAEESLLPKVGSMVEQRVAPVAQQVGQMAPAVQQVQQQQHLTAEQQTYAALDHLVPNWEQINGTEAFGNWLAQNDPYAGVPRGVMLAQAFQNGDAPRVAQFFTGFQRENAVVSPPAQTPPAASATPGVSLTSLVAPGTGTGGPPAGAPNEAGKRTYTAAEIAAFYRDVQKGAYRGRDADRIAIERDIFVAQKQGRVRAR